MIRRRALLACAASLAAPAAAAQKYPMGSKHEDVRFAGASGVTLSGTLLLPLLSAMIAIDAPFPVLPSETLLMSASALAFGEHRMLAVVGLFVAALIGSAAAGGFPAALSELAHPQLELTGPQGQRDVGHGLLGRIMDSDLAAGVRQRPRQVTAGRRLTLLECDLVSPPWDPGHCPPGVLWLLHLDGDRIRRVRLFHPAVAAG